MSNIQILIAGQVMSEQKTNLIHVLLHGYFLKLHYRLHSEIACEEHPVEPTQKNIEEYLQCIELLYPFDPNYFDQMFKPKHLYTIKNGIVTANFTLEECIEKYNLRQSPWKVSLS